MQKIKLEITGIAYSQTQSGSYVLTLLEVAGKRKLPIVIGGFEAQAIAVELEKMVPSRPLTHDLFKSFALTFDIQVKEIIIYNLVEGIFFSKIVCEQNGETYEIDARTSDAIAIGVRFNAPVFTLENILASAGILLDEDLIDTMSEEPAEQESSSKNIYQNLSLEELENKLNEAINNEEYEVASKIRDEINKRTSN